MAQQTLNNGEGYGTIRTKINSMFTELYGLISSLGGSISALVTSNNTLTTSVNTLTTTTNTLVTSDTTQNSRLTTLENTDISLDSRLDAVESLNTTQTSRLDAIDTLNTTQNTRLTQIENIGVTQVLAATALPAISVTTTPTKLTFFSSIPLQVGTATTANLSLQDVTINTNGVYKVSGNIILEFPQTDSLSIQLYKNGLPFTPEFNQQGLGAGKPINMGYTAVASLVATDVLTMYIKSLTATFTATIDASSVLIEKTHY